MAEHHADITENAVAQLGPIVDELHDKVTSPSDEERSAIGWAISDALKLGVRLGAAEVSGQVMEVARANGLDLQLFNVIIDPSEGEPRD